MKRVTTLIRPLIAIGIGLAVVSAITMPNAPGLLAAPDLRLAATTRTVTTPAEGAYWHTRTLLRSTQPEQFGRGANRYWVEERQIAEVWTSTDGKAWFGLRSLGARPKSAADEKAWRRDGSPSRLSRPAGDGPVTLDTKVDKGRLIAPKRSSPFYLAEQKLSYEEVQKLPADPSGLKAWLTKAVRVARAPEDAVDSGVAAALLTLLRDLPAPKEVRAAAYRALLTMPGVRSRGTAKDALGRTGTKLFIALDRVRHRPETEVIVDTDEMVSLAESLTAEVDGKPATGTSTMLQVGWTDTAPSVPALP
ncbi:CU044_5270 family protein [Nonomuraea sp. NPDC048901]|uniref:CU044_5270 family protein n=1 Tax=unclassified Nonomuraea TaxID=2593643 RepID=UPI0033EC86F2